MNKQWLIKINENENIWYDSDEKVYRRRMYCPHCRKVSGCLCYNDLEMAEHDEDEGMDYYCSSRCALLGGEWDDIGEAMSIVSVIKTIEELDDKQVGLILSKFERRWILYAMQDIRIFKHEKNLTRDDINKILKHLSVDVEEIIEELVDNKEMSSMCKSVEELTEEEAKKVLEILTEDADFDNVPSGDICRT